MIATNNRALFWQISNWRIGFKLPFFFLLFTVIPIVLIGLFVINLSRGALLAQGTVTLQSASQATTRQIDSELSEQREFIKVVGLLPDVVRYVQNPFDLAARDAAQRVLTAAVEKAGDYESVSIVNKDGTIILSSFSNDVGADVKFRPYFQEALKGAGYISDPAISVVTAQPAIFYSAPVKNDSGTVIAVVTSRVKMDSIWALVEADDGVAGPGSFGMLLDENGLRLAHSSSKGDRQTVQDILLYRAVAPLPVNVETTLVAEKRFGKATATDVQILPLPDVALRLTGADTSVFETRADTNNTRNQAVMVKLQGKPWRYLVAAPLATFTATADRTTSLIAILTVVVGGVAVAIALILSRSITRPLVHLSQVADRISLGELDVKIDVSSKDEVGDLAEALSRMQESLQAAIERLRGRRVSA